MPPQGGKGAGAVEGKELEEEEGLDSAERLRRTLARRWLLVVLNVLRSLLCVGVRTE